MRIMGNMKIVFGIIKTIVAGFLIIWIASLIWCQFLTIAHIDEFTENTVGEYLDMAKTKHIIKYDSNEAVIYCIGEVYVGEKKVNQYGIEIFYVKNEDDWIEEKAFPVWSSTGSASDVIWPYWWHFIYGGF